MIICDNGCPVNGTVTCCMECSERETCKQRCAETPDACGGSHTTNENGLEVFRSRQMETIQKIISVVRMKKECEDQEKKLKDQLKAAMEQYGIKKFDSDELSIVYVAEGTRSTVDTTALKRLYPDIAAECTKVSKTGAYVKVTVKGGDDK